MDQNNSQNLACSTDKPSFEIKQVYVKSLTYKVPHAPSIFSEKGQPEIHFELDVKHEKVSEDLYQVVVRVQTTAKVEQRTALTIELEQAGLFRLMNLDEQQQKFILNARCAGILSGYARKVISDASTDAGFGPINLSPIDFEGLYLENNAEKKPKIEKAKSSPMLFDSAKRTTNISEVN